MTITKKYFGGIAATLALTAGLVGCASRSSTPTATTLKASTTTSISPSSSQIDALVKVVQTRLGGGSRSQAIDIAQQACDVIDAAGSVPAAINGIVNDPSIDYETAGDMAYIMGVAIPVFCPEYEGQAARFAGN